MKQFLLGRARLLIVCVCSLFIMVLISACSGVATTTANGASTSTITGSIQSVNQSAHSVTLNVNGQQVTVSGLSDQQVATLQSQVGKVYSIQATQNGSTYSIAVGTDPQAASNAQQGVTQAATTSSNQPAGPSEPGTLDFIGKVQSSSTSSLVVLMPNGDTLPLTLTSLTDRSDLTGALNQGQQIKVKATANPDGSFTATKLGATDQGDLQDMTKLNTVSFTAMTTSAVSGNAIQFKVGNKSYSVVLTPTTEIKGFASAQSIGANQSIKIDVLFSGANGTALKIDNGNN